MAKRRRKKVVSRLTKMEPAAKVLLVGELAGGEAAVHEWYRKHGRRGRGSRPRRSGGGGAEVVVGRARMISTLATWRWASTGQ
jgi:hypothetical protein